MLILGKRPTTLTSFHEIIHQYHWTSHPPPKDFVIFAYLKNNNLSFNNLDYQIFTLYNLNYNTDYIIYKLK
jgi:hypothetical protein